MGHTSRLYRVTIVAVLLLTGCAAQPPKDGGTVSKMQEALDPGPAPAATATAVQPPASVSSALLPPVQLVDEHAGSAASEERFDISVNEVPTRDFLMGLVEGTPYNMVVHPAVTGTVSLSLKNVTIPEGIEALQTVYGYEFERSRSGFYAMPVRLQSRIYQVNYLNMKRVGLSHTRVSSGQISQAGGEDGGSESGSSDGGGGESGLITGSQINTETESDYWTELIATLELLVGTGEGREVVVMPQSGVVVVRAIPSELREVETFLHMNEGIMHRQVILEAKILEVELADGYEAGINWAKLIHVNGNHLLLGQSNGGDIFGDTRGNADRPSGGIIDPEFNSPFGLVDFASFGGFFGATFETNSFFGFLELLGLQGNVQVLSSPRISTVNNQKAVIKVGTDEFFVTDVSSTDSGNVGSVTNRLSQDIELTPFFSGIALDVTPQVDANGRVTLHIHPTISEVEDQEKEIDVGNGVVVLPLAKSTVRESDSIVYAESGQIIVIGGLMQEVKNEKIASTPWLSDVPGIGPLFRHTQQGSVKSELVILLRPTVVTGQQTWNQQLSGASEGIQALDRGFHFGGRTDVFGNLGDAKR